MYVQQKKKEKITKLVLFNQKVSYYYKTDEQSFILI